MPVVSAAQSATDVAEGKKLFGGLCVTCHGFDGAGGAGPPLNRPKLVIAPDDARCAAIIAEGIPNRGMPRVRRVTESELRAARGICAVDRTDRTPRCARQRAEAAQLYAKLGCAGCHIVNGTGRQPRARADRASDAMRGPAVSAPGDRSSRRHACHKGTCRFPRAVTASSCR